jgi:hypothetical protein
VSTGTSNGSTHRLHTSSKCLSAGLLDVHRQLDRRGDAVVLVLRVECRRVERSHDMLTGPAQLVEIEQHGLVPPCGWNP